MKKFILIILIISLIVVPMTACDQDTTTSDTPAADDTTQNDRLTEDTTEQEEEYTVEELTFPDYLPDIYFDGYTFRIINTEDGRITWLWTQLTAEEETGEALNDAILRRNRRMEERFGFELIQVDATGPGDVHTRARISIQAGSDDFDMAMMTPSYALRLAQEGMLVSIDTVPYIQLDQPWWDQNMNRDFSIGDRLFFTSGDFSFNQYSATIPILFNKVLHADLALDCPYTLVREGRWTIDRFGEMGRAALMDLTGTGTYDHEDQWGWMAFSHVYVPALMNGMGAGFIGRDADNLPYFAANTEHFITRFLHAIDILDGGWLFDGNQRGMGRPEHIWEEGRALFWTDLLNWATTLRAMENDFGILPMPKFDESQPHHISITGLPHVMCIPITTQNLERTGIILEALNAESRLTTLTVYYDTMLVNQIMRDEDSAEMLDIIFEHKVYEIGRFFWEGEIAGPIANAMAQGNREIASVIERHYNIATRAISRTIEAFDSH